MRNAIMGIEDLLNAAGGSKQFISEDSFEKNLEKQIEMAPATLETLRQLEDEPKEELRLEFFFYTNSAGKAKEFCECLKKKIICPTTKNQEAEKTYL